MKETLTVRMRFSPALKRGDEGLARLRYLREQGTIEEEITDEVLRGASIRWDILKRRALYPAIQPTRAQLVVGAERLLREGKIKPWGPDNFASHDRTGESQTAVSITGPLHSARVASSVARSNY